MKMESLGPLQSRGRSYLERPRPFRFTVHRNALAKEIANSQAFDQSTCFLRFVDTTDYKLMKLYVMPSYDMCECVAFVGFYM